jgi:hypothetical protein
MVNPCLFFLVIESKSEQPAIASKSMFPQILAASGSMFKRSDPSESLQENTTYWDLFSESTTPCMADLLSNLHAFRERTSSKDSAVDMTSVKGYLDVSAQSIPEAIDSDR